MYRHRADLFLYDTRHTCCRTYGYSKHRKLPPANRDHEHSPSIRCAAIAFRAVRGSGLCRSTMCRYVRVARGRGAPGEWHCLGLGSAGARHAGGHARGIQFSFARHVGDAVSMPAAPVGVFRAVCFVVKTGARCDFSRRRPAGGHVARCTPMCRSLSCVQLAQSRELYAAHSPHLQGQHHPLSIPSFIDFQRTCTQRPSRIYSKRHTRCKPCCCSTERAKV
jgi:hypothetical protein